MDRLPNIVNDLTKGSSERHNNDILLEQQSKTEIEKYNLENQYFSDTIKLRKEHANRIYKITKYYLFTVGTLVVATAICKFFGKEILSTSVLITILGTTTINVLGLMYILATHLFPTKK